MTTTRLCEFEIEVLKTCSGEDIPGMSWGAAMGQALECLRGSGYVDIHLGNYVITCKGRALLEGRPA